MFWILFAITIGGGMFGFIGMVAFVPLFAAVYALFSDFLSERLHKKGLPPETECYMTNEIHYSAAKKPAEGIIPAETAESAETEASADSGTEKADAEPAAPAEEGDDDEDDPDEGR